MNPAATPRSYALTDAARTRTSTSPGPATGSGTSITAAGTSNAVNASARMRFSFASYASATVGSPAIFLGSVRSGERAFEPRDVPVAFELPPLLGEVRHLPEAGPDVQRDRRVVRQCDPSDRAMQIPAGERV